MGPPQGWMNYQQPGPQGWNSLTQQQSQYRLGSYRLRVFSQTHAPRYQVVNPPRVAQAEQEDFDQVFVNVDDGIQYGAVPDTGSQLTTVSSRIAAKNGWLIVPPPPGEIHELEMANGIIIPRIGTVTIPITISFASGYFKPRRFMQQLEVMESNEPFLIGKDLIKVVFPRGEHLYECLPDDSGVSQYSKELRGVKCVRVEKRIAISNSNTHPLGPCQSSSSVHITATGAQVEDEECEFTREHFEAMGSLAPVTCTSCSHAPSQHRRASSADPRSSRPSSPSASRRRYAVIERATYAFSRSFPGGDGGSDNEDEYGEVEQERRRLIGDISSVSEALRTVQHPLITAEDNHRAQARQYKEAQRLVRRV
jgi:hypothetical protein